MSGLDTFKDRILFLRKYSKAKTNKAFAEMVGITEENYNSYLRGSIPTLRIISKILLSIKGLSADWLILGRGVPFPGMEETSNAVAEEPAVYESEENDNEDGFIEMRIKYEFMAREYEYLKEEFSKSTDTINNLSATLNKKSTADSA